MVWDRIVCGGVSIEESVDGLENRHIHGRKKTEKLKKNKNKEV